MTRELVAQEIIEALPAREWTGTVYRVMFLNYPPDRENTVGARWNPPEVAAIYTSTIAETAIAEINYHMSVQPRPFRPDLKRTLYEIQVHLDAVVDLNAAIPDLEAAGFSKDKLFANDMTASQAIGRTVTWFDRDGLLVPSARGKGPNLVIYPTWARNESYRFDVMSRREI